MHDFDGACDDEEDYILYFSAVEIHILLQQHNYNVNVGFGILSKGNSTYFERLFSAQQDDVKLYYIAIPIILDVQQFAKVQPPTTRTTRGLWNRGLTMRKHNTHTDQRCPINVRRRRRRLI